MIKYEVTQTWGDVRILKHTNIVRESKHYVWFPDDIRRVKASREAVFFSGRIEASDHALRILESRIENHRNLIKSLEKNISEDLEKTDKIAGGNGIDET